MMKILVVAAIALPMFAQAQPNEPGRVSQEEIQSMYNLMCVPGSEEYVMEDAKKMREFMHEVIKTPVESVAKLKQDAREGGFAGALGFGLTCGLLVATKAPMAEKGCTTEQGEKLDASEAIRLCEEAAKDLKAENDAQSAE